MKLSVNFDLLKKAAKQMGAEPIHFDISSKFEHAKIDDILGSTTGQQIDLKDPGLNLDGAGGLLSYQGRQVLLFLPKQFNDITLVKSDYTKGNKFHISDCSTLQQQIKRGTFKNYSATNNLHNKFRVYGFDHNNERDEFDTQLNVCQNCLKKLNYKNFNHENWNNKRDIVKNFQIDEFLETYSTLFEYLPDVYESTSNKEYTNDWNTISKNYRESKKYICETCDTSFIEYKNLLHTHHINGIKSDNNINNLKAVCVDCHRKEINHKHVMMTYEQLQHIHILRKKQNKIKINNWDDVFKFSDLSLYGYINILKNKNENKLPDIAVLVQSKNKQIALDLVWSNSRAKYALVTEYFYGYSELKDWNILTIGDAMSNDLQSIVEENNDIQAKSQSAFEFQSMIDYTAEIETLLEKMGARARGLHGKVTKVEQNLSENIVFRLRRIATIRNKKMHRKNFNNYVFTDFKEDCEVAIEYLKNIIN